MPLVYEINTRCWLRDLAERIGRTITLAEVPDSEFAEWQGLGFSHIWLMGVWTSGPRSRAVALAVEDLQKAYGNALQTVRRTDIVGSPYAIAEYRVSRTLGGDSGLQKFRSKLHQFGMRLILDFVPNHVGLDHLWLKNHPELFVQSADEKPGIFAQETVAVLKWIAHGRDPYFAPWPDTAQLDYRNPTTHDAMLQELLHVAERCDGVRCDMAMLVLSDVFTKTWKDHSLLTPSARGNLEFWPQAIALTKQRHPDFLFIAEVYWGLEERLQSFGFDFTYNKELYDEIVRRDAAAVQRRLLNAKPEFLKRSVNFLENHDEPRIASLLSEAEHGAAAALLLSLPGLRLLHEGQLSGATIRNPVQIRCRPKQPEHFAIRKLYEQLLSSLKRTENATCEILAPAAADPAATASNVILILRRTGSSEFILSAINLTPYPAHVFVTLPPDIHFDAAWLIQELFTTDTSVAPLSITDDLKVSIRLAAYGARVFEAGKPC